MYVMILTRLDISYVVSVVNRFMANPSKEQWKSCEMDSEILSGDYRL